MLWASRIFKNLKQIFLLLKNGLFTELCTDLVDIFSFDSSVLKG